MASRAAQVARRIVETQAALSPQHVSALLRMSSESKSLLEKRAREAPTTLVPLVGAYSQAGRFDDALRVLREAAREEARPLLVRAYEPLLVGCVRSNDDGALRAASRLMRSQQLQPDGSLYGSLILARLERGELPRALTLCEAALADACPPPVRAVDPLLVALARDGLNGTALDLIAQLRRRHGVLLAPSDAATRTLLDAAATSSASLEAASVFAELRWHVPGARRGAGREGVARLSGRGVGGAAVVAGVEPGARGDGGVPLHEELLRRCLRAGNLPAAWALYREVDHTGGALS